jgi:hypothetical protein
MPSDSISLSNPLARILLPNRDHTRAAKVIGWWELRRPLYNALVGIVGLITIGAMVAVGSFCERRGGASIGIPDPPLFALAGVFVYGVAANTCYTGGWITELLVARIWHADTKSFGPIAFVLGTTFSALLTLSPALVVLGLALSTSCRGLPT